MVPGLHRLRAPLAAALLAAGLAHAQEPAPTPTPAPEGEAAAPSNEELARRIEVLTQELESMKLGEAAGGGEAGKSGVFGLGPAASKVYKVKSGLSIGGYGESLYQNFDTKRDDGTASSKTNEWDYLRAILYVGWKFSPRFVLNTEIEYEHASTGKGGEVSVEFATLDALLSKEINLRGGMMLAPVGLVNELHEPPIFLGARRPEVESNVIPTTWRFNGVGAFGDLGPVAYKLYVVEGLNAKSFTASSGIRGGRQSGARAKADDLGVTGRFDLVTVPGLLAGVSFYTGKSGQELADAGGDIGARTTLFDVHAEYRVAGLQLRALWARVSQGDVAALNQAIGLTGNKSIGERMEGWYLQAGYDVWPLFRRGSGMALTPFVRHERYDTQKRVPEGFARDRANDRRVTTLGIDFKPVPQVVVKVDWQDQRNAARTGVDQWNFAVGYLF